MFNFGVRFIYEVFLELSLCAILAFAHAKKGSFDYHAANMILVFQSLFILHAFAAQGSPLLRYQRDKSLLKNALNDDQHL